MKFRLVLLALIAATPMPVLAQPAPAPAPAPAPPDQPPQPQPDQPPQEPAPSWHMPPERLWALVASPDLLELPLEQQQGLCHSIPAPRRTPC